MEVAKNTPSLVSYSPLGFGLGSFTRLITASAYTLEVTGAVRASPCFLYKLCLDAQCAMNWVHPLGRTFA